MTTKYTRENLSLLNGNRYYYSRFAPDLFIENGQCVVNDKAFPSLNSALNVICEAMDKSPNSLRAKHVINYDSHLTLEDDMLNALICKAQEDAQSVKINKLVDSEINLAKELFGIDVPEYVKDKYTQIVRLILDIFPIW